MAITPSTNGVTIEFRKADGSHDETKEPVFGKYVTFYSKPRPTGLSHDPINGSDDWLTHVLVADSCERLSALQAAVTDHTQCATSGCSKGVTVTYDVGGKKATTTNAVTIASKSNGHLGDTTVAELVRVMPSGTVMNENNQLWDEWKEIYIHLMNLKNRRHTSAAHSC